MATGGAGESLGSGYVLLDEIGAGAMGSVWRARHRETGELVAVKLLRNSLAADQELVMRFVQERTVMRTLRHPNIVAVRDFVVEGERLALVMDLIEGGNLHTLLRRRGTLPPGEAAQVMAQVADALTVAHAQGVVHRDVKPSNVLIDAATGQARLTDFGVARIVHGPGLTQSTSIIGTPTYLAPEVANGDEPTPAMDVYAAGLILYELLAGRPPFVGQHPIALLRQHAMAVPRRLPGMPDALWSVISACTAKAPAQRPAIEQVASWLRAAAPSLAGLPALPPVSWQEPPFATSESLPSMPFPAVDPGALPVVDPAATAPGTGAAAAAVSTAGVGGGAAGAPGAGVQAAPEARRGGVRGRLLIAGASVLAVAVSATVVATVAPWRTLDAEAMGGQATLPASPSSSSPGSSSPSAAPPSADALVASPVPGPPTVKPKYGFPTGSDRMVSRMSSPVWTQTETGGIEFWSRQTCSPGATTYWVTLRPKRETVGFSCGSWQYHKWADVRPGTYRLEIWKADDDQKIKGSGVLRSSVPIAVRAEPDGTAATTPSPRPRQTPERPPATTSSPKPRRTPGRVVITSSPEARPEQRRTPDVTDRQPALNWQCRAWFALTPGVEMSPCMAMVGDVFYMLGRIRGSSSVRSDIHIQLFDSTRDVNVSPPHICVGVSPPSDGGIVTCGPVTATAPRTGGNRHDVRQRWRKTGTEAFGGGVESPSVPW